MAFLDELSKKLSGVSRVAVRKAKEVTDIGSLKLQIADENRKLSKIYENLGREYYDRFQDEAAEELSGLVKQIKDSTDKIAAFQDEISRVEAESADVQKKSVSAGRQRLRPEESLWQKQRCGKSMKTKDTKNTKTKRLKKTAK